MKTDNVVTFMPGKHLLEKAEAYIQSIELFLEEKERAADIILKALKFAKSDFKQKIILFIGTLEKEKAAWPFYHILSDPGEDDEIRHVASIQLSIIFPYLKDRNPLIERLLEDLRSDDPLMRMNAAFALGWEGNSQAAISLIDLLYDPDLRVQESAVNSLSNLRDDRIFNLLVDRLESCAIEQKQCILFNLWRFYSKQKEAVSVYLRYSKHENAELRYDALLLLGGIEDPGNYLDVLHEGIYDDDARVRILSLERLLEVEKDKILFMKKEVEELIAVADNVVRPSALKLLHHLTST